MTPEEIARSQAKTCACDLIVDVYAGAGGNTIQFARTCGFGKSSGTGHTFFGYFLAQAFPLLSLPIKLINHLAGTVFF